MSHQRVEYFGLALLGSRPVSRPVKDVRSSSDDQLKCCGPFMDIFGLGLFLGSEIETFREKTKDLCLSVLIQCFSGCTSYKAQPSSVELQELG